MELTREEAKRLIKLHGHKMSYCKMCGPMVICGYCGNNCCNAGTGNNCKDSCKEAYEIQAVIKYPWYSQIRDLICRRFFNVIKLKCINNIYKITHWYWEK